MDAWLGLDVGTSSTKAVAYGTDGTRLAAARVPTQWRTTPHLVDIEAHVLQEGALAAADQAAGALPAGVRVRGIGITGMGETGVLVDGRGRPVAPAIAWHDQRDHVEVEQLQSDLPQFARRAGKPMRGQWSLTKHRWLMTHVADSRAAVRRFNVAEWVALGLGSEQACDRTLACRTGWFDLFADEWWPEALDWSQASASLMPPLVQPGEPIGRVRGRCSALDGAVITLAGHDHQAAAVGAGAEAIGDEFDSSGTAEALIRTVGSDLTESQVGALAAAGVTTDVSVQPGRWSLLGGTEGGLAMQRALSVLGVEWADLARLDQLAAQADPGQVQVLGIGGEALTIAGLGDGVGPGHVWRAVVEAATAQARALHDAMSEIVGAHRDLVAAGGWCRSAAVLAAKRTAFGVISMSEVDEPGTFGAAILAARAAGALGVHERLGSS